MESNYEDSLEISQFQSTTENNDIMSMATEDDPLILSETNEQSSASNQLAFNPKKALNLIFSLQDDEIDRIEEHLRSKLIENGEKFYLKYENLRISNEKYTIENEQRFVELEAEYNECQQKLGVESKNAHIYKLQADQNEERFGTLSKQVKILENEKEIFKSNQERLNTVNQNLEAEKRDLIVLLDKKIKDNDRLNEEWKSMNNKLCESENKICELTAKLEELQHKESTISLKEKQFQCDRERLLNEIEWLNQQLKEKSNQILELKSSTSKKVYELETKLEEFSLENKNLKTTIETLQAANSEMNTQIEELTTKLQEVRQKEAQSRIEFNEEAFARERLIEMYKEENESCKLRLEEATNAIGEFKQVVLELKDEYTKLADEKSTNEATYEVQRKEHEETISKLEQELKNANELLSIAKRKGAAVLSESDIEQLSPAAAVASRLLKSGMSLTQIYSEYVNLTEKYEQERKDKERVEAYLNQVMQEIEEKAPIFKRQKQEYEEAVKTVNNLTTQLENAMMDYEVLKSKSEDSIKKYNLVASENVRLKQDVQDLSRQVTVLLHEIEKLRGKMLNKSSFDDASNTSLNRTQELINESSGEVTSSSEMANRNVLLYRNIDELQKQNQKLLRMVHEITDKRQTEERAELEMRTNDFNEKLNLAMRELEEFRYQREKQEQVLDEIRKQRDNYKHLLQQQQQFHQQQQQGGQQSQQVSFFTSTPGFIRKRMPEMDHMGDDTAGVHLIDEKTDETKSALEKLQKQFDKYQEEMMKTNKVLNEEIETFRTANSDLTLKLALSESKLESIVEKCKTLSTSVDKHRKDLDTAREKSSKCNEILIKHEQTISLLNAELNKAKERVNELETKLHSTSVERDMFKSNHERLSKENEILFRENSSRNSILSNLEIIRSSCERNEREAKLIFTQKIEQLERENQIQKKQLEQDKEQHEVLLKSWQNQYNLLMEQHEKLSAENERNKVAFNELKDEFDKLTKKHMEVEAKLHSNELIVQMTRNSKSSSAISRLTHLEEENKDLQMKVALADKDIVSLKIQLEESRAHTKQYKTIAETMEKTVKEASESIAKTKQILEEQIDQLNKRISELNEQVSRQLEENANMQSKLASEKANYEQSTNDLNAEIGRLGKELDTVRKRLENTEKILDERTRHRDDYAAKVVVLEEQVRESTERQQVAEKELEQSRAEASKHADELRSLSEQLDTERKCKTELQTSLGSSSHLVEENMSNLQNENKQLVEQINLLQQELSKMGQDLIILQKQENKLFAGLDTRSSMSVGDEEMPLASSSSSTSSSSSNLLEINRYLRQQKDQLEENYENLKLNFEINQQRLRTIQNDLDFYKSQSEMYKCQVEQVSASMTNTSESESMNQLLTDTNRILKEQCDSLSADNVRIQSEMRQLEVESNDLKATLSASELKCESILGENNCLKSEIKKWKNRVDAILSSSELSQEWAKMQAELNEAQQKAQLMTDQVNELQVKWSEADKKCVELTSELTRLKQQTSEEKAKAQHDFDQFRTERARREEMFKLLVSELKDVVTTVQKDLELKDFEWGTIKGPDRMKNIKDELLIIKSKLLEKIKHDKQELKSKGELLADLQKRHDECENKLKEKEIRIGQLNNFIQSTKTRLQTQAKTIEELNKELNDVKKELNEAKSASGAHSATDSHSEHSKLELDALKSKLLQSQMDNERLKKELSQRNQQQQEQQQTKATTSNLSTSNQMASGSPSSQVSQVAPSSSASVENTQQPQQPPTAYIAPSRVTPKVNQSANLVSLRRTAAIQPTFNESTPRQLVAPMINEQSVSQSQLQTQATTPVSATLSSSLVANESENPSVQSEPQTASNPSTSNNAGTSQMFMTKRTREQDDQNDDVNMPTQGLNNKKQRNSFEQELAASSEFGQSEQQGEQQMLNEEAQQQNVQYATIEPYNANPSNVQIDEYIVVNDESQNNEEQQLQQQHNQEEIVLDDDNQGEDGNEQYDEVIMHQANQMQSNQDSNSNQMGSDEPIESYANDEDAPEIIDQDDGDVVASTGEQVVVDEDIEHLGDVETLDEEQSDDLHLETPIAESETEQDTEFRPSSATMNENFGDSNPSQELLENVNTVEFEQHLSSDEPQLQAESNQQSATSESFQQTQQTNQQILANNQQAQAVQQQQQIQITRREMPKPIVWDAPSATNTFQSFGSQQQSNNFRIRRPPVTQNFSAPFSQQQQQQQANQMALQQGQQQNQQTFFQQQQQQPGAPQAFQSNQYRLQNARFQLQPGALGSGALIQSSTPIITATDTSLHLNQQQQLQAQNQQILQQQRIIAEQQGSLIRLQRAQLNLPQLQQQQQQLQPGTQLQQQQPQSQQQGRIIQTINTRGGGAPRGGRGAPRGGRTF